MASLTTVTLLLDQSIGSPFLKHKFLQDHKLNIFNLQLKEWNIPKRSGDGISLVLAYDDYLIVEENLGFGNYALSLYANDDNDKSHNLLFAKDPICNLKHHNQYSAIRTMCLERVVENNQQIDYLLILSHHYLYKYNLKEWIENSKSNRTTEYIWRTGLAYEAYNTEAYCYPRSIICVESKGKYSNVKGNLLVVADTDNSRLKLQDSWDGNCLGICTELGGVPIGKPVNVIYSKELDVFLMVSFNKSFFKFKISSDLQFIESTELKTKESIWCLGYEPTSGKVFYPNSNFSILSVMDFESLKVEMQYNTNKTVTNISFDPKYQRFYLIYQGVSFVLEK